MQGSANLNLMIKAARRAGKSLVKDFREVENLQVSTKGPGDFVSKADRAAEDMIKSDLMGTTHLWLDRRRDGFGRGPRSNTPLDRGTIGWHHQFLAWYAALGSLYRPRA